MLAIYDAMRDTIRTQLQTYGPYDKNTMPKRPRLHRFKHDADGLISVLGVDNLTRIDPRARPSSYTYYDARAVPAGYEYSALPAPAAPAARPAGQQSLDNFVVASG